MDIFVGSLPFKLKEDELKELFEKHGLVTKATIIIDKISRLNKGFGFIEMPNEEEAKEAIKHINGMELMGRTLVVNKSEKKPSKPDFKKQSSSENKPYNWRNKPKKKFGPPEITYGIDKDGKPKRPKIKSAKNFKVGKRRKG